MSLTKLTKEVDNISALSDYPNSTEGLSSQDLKERFDKASVDIKDYINSTLTDELDTIHANYEETLATKEEVDLDYLKKTDAEATYETIENVDAYKDEVDETYLKKDDAGEIYLSKDDASNDYLTKNEASTTYDTISNVANIYATKQALAEAQMGAIVDQSVTKEKLSLDVQATLDNAEQNIDDLVTSVASINGKIPSEASTTNQLADKDYVDGRVQENTANFIGRFDSVAELEAYAGTLTNNDYAYVVTQEVGGNEKIVRYRYVTNTTSWEEEFDMNNTIFTQSQLDTINSGLTASDNAKLINKYNIPSVEKVGALLNGMPLYNEWSNNNIESTYNDMKVIVDSQYQATDNASGIFGINDSTAWRSSTSGTLHTIIIDLGKIVNISSIKHKIMAQSSVSVNGICKYSLDNITYNNLYTFIQENDITNHSFTNTNVRYIKYELSVTNGKFVIVRGLDIPDNTYISNTKFSNSFTLDNNTSFTNNQRVLIDTTYYGAKQGNIFGNVSSENTYSTRTNYTNETCTILGENITAKISFNINSFFNGSTGVDSISKADLNALFSSTSKVSNKGFNLNPSYNSFIKFDLQDISSCKIALWTYQTNTTIYISTDDVTYNELHHIASGEVENHFEIEIPTDTRYVKVECNTAYGGTNCDLMYIYLKDIEYQGLIEKFDDISSNTLNGVNIPTLLQPSTKYELVYNQTQNKFLLDGLMDDKILFNITLPNAVNQVNLTGISNILEEGKLYCLIVDGKMNNNTKFALGMTDNGYLKMSKDCCFILFTKFINSNNYTILRCFAQISSEGSNTNPVTVDSRIDGREWIKASSTYTFSAGTKIIIKEVA